jgi:Zn-dependent M32 family carboxypeptidase
MVPYLERTLDLSREYSSYFAPYENVADPHIDDADEGMTTATIRKLFAELKRQLAPMLRTICEQPAADDSSLRRTFAKGTQFDFALHVAESLGYDLKRGRLDLTHHPFCTRFSAGDVRITTRVNGNDLGDALFSTLHEAGHGMYEQGISAVLDGSPLGRGVSAGVHESQSRLWENVVADLVFQGSNAERSLPAIQLRNISPTRWQRSIRSCLDARMEIREVLLEALCVLGPCHLVDAGRGELLPPGEARPQNIDGKMMQERR